MDVSQRFENFNRLGFCINCLSKGHQVNNCSFQCRFCSRSQHSLLHRSQPASENSSTAADPSRSPIALNESPAAVHTHITKSSPEQILLGFCTRRFRMLSIVVSSIRLLLSTKFYYRRILYKIKFDS